MERMGGQTCSARMVVMKTLSEPIEGIIVLQVGEELAKNSGCKERPKKADFDRSQTLRSPMCLKTLLLTK
jgi:hypothetical protein